MFSNWTVARKITGVVGIGLFFLLLIGVMSYSSISDMIETQDWVTHTHEVLETNELVLSLLKDAETGQRGNVITGEEGSPRTWAQTPARRSRGRPSGHWRISPRYRS